MCGNVLCNAPTEVMTYTPLTTIEEKILFLRAINSLPRDIKQSELWPRIVGPCPAPPAPPAPRKRRSQ